MLGEFSYIEKSSLGGRTIVSGFFTKESVEKAARRRLKQVRLEHRLDPIRREEPLGMEDKIRIQRPDYSTYPITQKPTLVVRFQRKFSHR